MGKRSGEGFVAHKATLVTRLSRCVEDRLTLMDITIGRKGFATFVKALSGSNIVKVVPASPENGSKLLKVVCGANTSILADGAWIGEKTPMTFADVIACPHNSVMPNMSSVELAEAITRVLPFTSDEENRPILQNVLFKAGGGVLELIASNGFTLAIQRLDYGDSEGQVLVHKDELKGIANALRKARRVRFVIEPGGETDEQAVVIETEAIRYRFVGYDGNYPDYAKIIPSDHTTLAHLDSVEAVKAIASLRTMADNPKSYAVDLMVEAGVVLLSNPDGNADTSLPADTEGTGEIRIDGKYLANVLKACGGMVDFTFTKSYSPMMFRTDGYLAVVNPMLSPKATEQKRLDSEAKAELAEAKRAKAEAKKAEAEAKAKAEAEAKEVAAATA